MASLGILAWVTYRLSRQRILRLPLDVALALVAPGLFAYSLAHALLRGTWPVGPWLIAGLGLWSVVSMTLRLRSFVLFWPEGQPAAGIGLTPFQPAALRASGFFEVGSHRRYFAEAAGCLYATELGERVLMVEVQRLSLLGLFGSPDEEWGCWYSFFRPEELWQVTSGHIAFGWRPRPALRLKHADPRRAVTYLSFDSPHARDLVAGDLAGDAASAQVHPS